MTCPLCDLPLADVPSQRWRDTRVHQGCLDDFYGDVEVDL